MGSSHNNFNSKGSKRRNAISEINVTPFVDVLLVLLIIFMVAAPMMTSSINVNLPEGSANKDEKKIEPITISMDSSKKIFLQDQEIKISELPKKLLEITNQNFSSKIHVRGDEALDYGKIMDLVKIIGDSGFKQIVLVTEISQ
jgi:biopolymer transport protein TolR